MNKPIFYLPFSTLVILSIVYISISVSSYSLMIDFQRLLYISFAMATITAVVVYFLSKNKFDPDNLYKLTGSSVLFSFVLWMAFFTYMNKKYTTKNCNTASYELVGYKGRYGSGLGKMDKDQIKANQWILTIIKDGKQMSFVLDKDISHNNRVTKTMDLQFCKGILGIEYLNIEQIAR